MAGFRGLRPEIRYGASYATILTFRFWLDTPDAFSEPRIDAALRKNATGERVAAATYGHDQKLYGWARRIPRADFDDGAKVISGWPAWRDFLRYAWTLQPWRWVYEAGTYGGPTTYFDAELLAPEPMWAEGPDLEGNGMRRVELLILRKNGTSDTGSAVEGY